jgi:hypothetical protein
MQLLKGIYLTRYNAVQLEEYVGTTLKSKRISHTLLPTSFWFVASLTLEPRRNKRLVPPKRPFIFAAVHGVVSYKIESFLTTAVITSNPKQWG